MSTTSKNRFKIQFKSTRTSYRLSCFCSEFEKDIASRNTNLELWFDQMHFQMLHYRRAMYWMLLQELYFRDPIQFRCHVLWREAASMTLHVSDLVQHSKQFFTEFFGIRSHLCISDRLIGCDCMYQLTCTYIVAPVIATDSLVC